MKGGAAAGVVQKAAAMAQPGEPRRRSMIRTGRATLPRWTTAPTWSNKISIDSTALRTGGPNNIHLSSAHRSPNSQHVRVPSLRAPARLGPSIAPSSHRSPSNPPLRAHRLLRSSMYRVRVLVTSSPIMAHRQVQAGILVICLEFCSFFCLFCSSIPFFK